MPISVDVRVPAGIGIPVRVLLSDVSRSLRGWRSVLSEVSISSNIRVPSGIGSLVDSLTNVGILASIKIPARIPATFRIPSIIRIPVRALASIRVFQVLGFCVGVSRWDACPCA